MAHDESMSWHGMARSSNLQRNLLIWTALEGCAHTIASLLIGCFVFGQFCYLDITASVLNIA